MKELDGIKNRFKRFEECLALLQHIRDNIPEAEYLREPFYYSTGERNLQVAIEVLLDISDSIISQHGFRQPEDYSDIINVLRENDVLPSEFSQRIAKLPAFRNLLVHEYLLVDRKIVYEKIKTSIPDLEEYARYLLNFLKF